MSLLPRTFLKADNDLRLRFYGQRYEFAGMVTRVVVGHSRDIKNLRGRNLPFEARRRCGVPVEPSLVV
jgi:hypothetical protein